MAAPIFTSEELVFLNELLEQRVEFMVVGLSAATMQGAPVVTQDVELWFRDLSDPNISEAAKKAGGVFIPAIQMQPPMIGGEGLRLFDIVLNLDGIESFENEKTHMLYLEVEGLRVPVLSLERIIESKRAAGRAKDKLTLPVLEDTLKTLQNP